MYNAQRRDWDGARPRDATSVDGARSSAEGEVEVTPSSVGVVISFSFTGFCSGGGLRLRERVLCLEDMQVCCIPRSSRGFGLSIL